MVHKQQQHTQRAQLWPNICKTSGNANGVVKNVFVCVLRNEQKWESAWERKQKEKQENGFECVQTVV